MGADRPKFLENIFISALNKSSMFCCALRRERQQALVICSKSMSPLKCGGLNYCFNEASARGASVEEMRRDIAWLQTNLGL